MLDPIYLETDQVIVHAFRPEEVARHETLVNEIFDILSDKETLKFLPEKRLLSPEEAGHWLKLTVLNFHCGHNFLHFITDKRSGKLLGMVDIFSPETIKSHYRLIHYSYFMEFYLSSSARGNGIMTNLLPSLLEELAQLGITEISAIANIENQPARKVLTNASFIEQGLFDHHQILYTYLRPMEDGRLRRVG